ncbi:MAG: glycosyltransferase family 4 protein [Acidimicrobiales bacterium]
MRRHLLVTNDFPPKIGGIQNYLWELWRRLPAGAAAVYTTPYSGTAAFDARQPFPIERSPEPWLIPYPWLTSRVRRMALEAECDLVLLDPAIPLGVIGPGLDLPYGVILHGAEVTIPGRLPALRQTLARTLRAASLVVSAGHYALAEAERCAGRSLPSIVIPPGVDSQRFSPPSPDARAKTRARYGVGADDILLATVSRLVPRKGMETLIRASAEVARRHSASPSGFASAGSASRPGSASAGSGPGFRVVIGGTGRQAGELAALASELAAPVDLPGRLGDDEVVDLYGAADLMAMLCNERWFGLEQEGFGIVFLEAAAVGLPQVAGRSGGAHEAVEHEVTGLIVDDPGDISAAAEAIERLIDDADLRHRLGRAARRRAVEEFDYSRLAGQLQGAIDSCDLRPPR